METFKFPDIKMEKANALSRYRRIKRIATFFRFLELLVFLIALYRFSTHFPFSTEYLKGISSKIISPKFVFVVGNAIVIALFFISGHFSSTDKAGERGRSRTDFYDEYVEKCRNNYNHSQQQQNIIEGDKLVTKAYERIAPREPKRTMNRVHSENLERAVIVGSEEHRRDLRRSASEKWKKSADCGGRKADGGSSYAEDEMSSEEFRRTVEAFIARQQRFLREEEDYPAAVSI